MGIIFKNADIVTMESESSVIRNGFVKVIGNKIVYVGKNEPEILPEDETIDCTHRILMPGLYNNHSHIPMTLLRGVGEGLPLERWLNEKIFPAEAKLNDEIVRCGTLLGAAEMIASGTVSYSDMYFFCDTIAEATVSAGMKANISWCLVQADYKDISTDKRIQNATRFYREYNGAGNGRIIADTSFHAIYTTSEEYLREVGEYLATFNTGMQIHLSETKTEQEGCLARYGRTPSQVFNDAGIFNMPTIAAHGVYLTDEDMELLALNNVFVAHNPTSNMKLGSGIARVSEMLKKGVNVVLGTDGCASNNNLNMFEEMHLAALLGKGFYQDPTLLSPYDVLKMATVTGAAAQRRKGGIIAEGYPADIILVDCDKPHMVPHIDILSNLVYSAQGSDVTLNMTDGNILYHDGEYKTIDIERVKYEANRFAKFIRE